MYKDIIKPFSDFLIALIAFIILLPLFMVIMVVLSIVLKGSPFFIQRRPGKHERIFAIVKFRTMSNQRDSNGNLLPDAERLSGFGKLVRSTSLDEIPQLLNVIVGQMSLVGPRPLLPEYLPLYNSEQRKRHDVKPGITGWAQVNGRNAVSWQKKFEMDYYYVRNISFSLDLKIVLLTLKKVVKRSDIQGADHSTVSPFKGN